LSKFGATVREVRELLSKFEDDDIVFIHNQNVRVVKKSELGEKVASHLKYRASYLNNQAEEDDTDL